MTACTGCSAKSAFSRDETLASALPTRIQSIDVDCRCCGRYTGTDERPYVDRVICDPFGKKSPIVPHGIPLGEKSARNFVWATYSVRPMAGNQAVNWSRRQRGFGNHKCLAAVLLPPSLSDYPSSNPQKTFGSETTSCTRGVSCSRVR